MKRKLKTKKMRNKIIYDLNQLMGRRLKITKHFLICRTTQIRFDDVNVIQHLVQRKNETEIHTRDQLPQ